MNNSNLQYAIERSSRATAELERRDKEVLQIYRPSRQQVAVHTSKAHELIVRGGKRSGKSLSTAVEFVSRIMGIPVLGPDGTPYESHWEPSTNEAPGLYWIIGWDWRHIGETIHRLLFEPGMGKGGLFRVIKDKKTGKWRTWNPANPFDMARKAESELPPPLIPLRFLKGGTDAFSWKAAGLKQFESVELINGARINAYPSSGDNPKQGDAVSGIWIDEDIQNGNFLKEWQDRLTDKDGWMMWSVWPHTANFALVDLIDRAEEVAETDNPDIEVAQLLMTENEYIKDEAKQRSLGRMGSEAEIARRDRGELPTDRNMYDFTPAIHLVDSWRPIAGLRDMKPTNFYEVLRKELEFSARLPREWTRYIGMDPSNTRTAVLFGVVPPPEINGLFVGNRLVIEAELIASQYTADALAEAIANFTGGFNYEAFVIDKMAGRQTHAGRDDRTAELYEKAFAKKRILSRETGSGFVYGCTVLSRRFQAVRDLLVCREDNWASLVLLETHTPATQKEFRTYRKKVLERNGTVEVYDEPSNPRVHDCMQALEYLVEYVGNRFDAGTAYVPPENYTGGGSPAYNAAQAMLKKLGQAQGDYVHLGPGNVAAA